MEFLCVFRSESDRDTRNLLIVAVFSGILSILLVALIVGSAQKVSPGQLDTVNLVTFIFCLFAYMFARRYVATQSSRPCGTSRHEDATSHLGENSIF